VGLSVRRHRVDPWAFNPVSCLSRRDRSIAADRGAGDPRPCRESESLTFPTTNRPRDKVEVAGDCCTPGIALDEIYVGPAECLEPSASDIEDGAINLDAHDVAIGSDRVCPNQRHIPAPLPNVEDAQ
jgi:hypothetical protein